MKGVDCVGKVFTSNKCGDFEVVEYIDYDNVVVRFLDTGYTTTTQLYHVKDGAIKDRLQPSVYGVGVMGDSVGSINGENLKEYRLWRGLLCRCYNEKTKRNLPSYENCSVSENFKYFPYFQNWCYNQIGFNNAGFELDKDILIKGNKVYSEDVCVFVPKEINLLLCNAKRIRGSLPIGVRLSRAQGRYLAYITKMGKYVGLGTYSTPEEAFQVYKEAKEAYIKEVANKWRDQIDTRVYEALMNWEVDLND